MIKKNKFLALSIRAKLLTVVGLLSFGLIGVCGYLGVYQAYQNWQYSEGLSVANRMSDHLLYAASREALERGIGNAALSQVYTSNQANPQLIEALQQQRLKGDEALDQALSLATELSQTDWINPIFEQYLDKVLSDRGTATNARQMLDATLDGKENQITSQIWLEKMTALIHSGAKLREAAFLPLTGAKSAPYINQEIKHAVWLASEYAGLERAMIAQTIASGKAMPIATREKLATYRAHVDMHISELIKGVENIRGYLDGPEKASIGQALKIMEDIFLGRFERIREQVYAKKDTGEYPLTPEMWLTHSTEGIESILAVNQSVSKFIDINLHRDHEQKMDYIWFSLASILLTILLSVLATLAVFSIAKRVDRFVLEIGKVQKNKDLTRRLSDHSQDELGRITCAFNQFLDNVDELIAKTLDSTIEVADAASAMSTVAQQTHAGIKIQQTETTEVTGAVDEMVQKINDVAKNSHQAYDAAHKAKEEASKGSEITDETITAIHALAGDVQKAAEVVQEFEQHSEEIGGIVGVIQGISEQTNLLALNAAIEAARVGESGRGFAVVADEVRNLAKRTRESTEKIQKIIAGLHNSSSEAVRRMEESSNKAEHTVQRAAMTAQALQAITQAVDAIAELNEQIAAATQEQAAVSNGISVNLLTNIGQFSQIARQSAEQTQSATVGLGGAISDLQKQMNQYRFSEPGHLRLHAAKAAHFSWIVRIKSFLDGHETLTRDEALSPRGCEFGQWYYSKDATPYREIHEMAEIEKPHNELHQIVQRILELKEQGQISEAERLTDQVETLSHQLTSLIEAVEEKAGAKRQSKYRINTIETETEADFDDILF